MKIQLTSLKKLFQVAFLTGGFALFAGNAMAAPQDHLGVENAHIQAKGQALMAKGHASIVKEARTAQINLIKAMRAIAQKNYPAAQSFLKTADNQLGILLKKNPSMSEALIDTNITMSDFVGSLKGLKSNIAQAKKALEDGQVQQARAILMPLSSQLELTSEYLPLKTYPQQIKLAEKQLKAHHPKKALTTLSVTLNTVLVKQAVVSIPLLNAQTDILTAQTLYQEDPKKNQKQVLSFLKQAKENLQLNTLLGYPGGKQVQVELKKVTEKVTGGSKIAHLFDTLSNKAHALDQEIISKAISLKHSL